MATGGRGLAAFAIWVGLLGWALQSAVEFGLYVPAVGWAAFWLFGYLWGYPREPQRSPNPVDTVAPTT